MFQTSENIGANGGAIKVGTTGTISSLMSRELDSVGATLQASKFFQRQAGSTPKKSQPRRTPPAESCSSSRSNYNTEKKKSRDTHRVRHNHRNRQQVPMLGSESITVDPNLKSNKSDKKGYVNIVEVVDIKCGNPMSNKLKKIGFSKLSQSIA